MSERYDDTTLRMEALRFAMMGNQGYPDPAQLVKSAEIFHRYLCGESAAKSNDGSEPA